MEEIYRKKYKKQKENEEKELRNIKNESEVWKFINKRRKKESIDNNISKERWAEFFRRTLQGAEEKRKRRKKRKR